jgi:methionyl-tRNA synthetase
MVSMHNSELADTLGNLVHRGVNLCIKYCEGKIPDVQHDPQFGLPFDLAALEAGVRADLESCAMNSAIFKAMEAVRATNRFLTEAEPWKMKGEGSEMKRIAVVRTTLEAIFAFTHYLAPVIPHAAAAVFQKLGTQPIPTNTLKMDFYNLKPGTEVFLGDILFQKIISEETPAAISNATAAAVKKPEKKSGGKPAASVVEEAENPNQIDFSKIELRIGRIMRVWNHETADRLYCEEIDVKDADGTLRPVVSGLRAHYSLEEMKGRLVVVVCNLKEAKMQGFISRGMVLAAKGSDGRVELIDPPAGAEVGELVELEGFARDGPVWQAAKVKKMKVWEKVSELLRTDSSGAATWDGKALVTSAGRCRAATLVEAPIS